MGSKVIKWSLERIVNMICDMIQNEFDCFIVIEGNRGLGKSTLAYHLANRISLEMNRRDVKGYRFNMKKDLLYKRKSVIQFFNQWHKIGIADEMINVTFNRDFYNPDQKDLIKMIDMNRDHCNLFLACVPRFLSLDSQIKSLCKIRFSVVRRGLAILQTPNRTFYSKDKWDGFNNQKIERQWAKSNISKPQYSKLTTFRGIVSFPKLTKKQEKIYKRTKREKRNEIWKEKHGKEEEDTFDPFEDCYTRLLNHAIKDGQAIQGYAFAMNMKPNTLRNKLIKRLKKDKKNPSLRYWYYGTKSPASKKKKEDPKLKEIITKGRVNRLTE